MRCVRGLRQGRSRHISGALCRQVADTVKAGQQLLPERRRRINAAWIVARHPNNRNGFRHRCADNRGVVCVLSNRTLLAGERFGGGGCFRQLEHILEQIGGQRFDRGVVKEQGGAHRTAQASLNAIAQFHRHERIHAQVKEPGPGINRRN